MIRRSGSVSAHNSSSTAMHGRANRVVPAAATLPNRPRAAEVTEPTPRAPAAMDPTQAAAAIRHGAATPARASRPRSALRERAQVVLHRLVIVAVYTASFDLAHISAPRVPSLDELFRAVDTARRGARGHCRAAP